MHEGHRKRLTAKIKNSDALYDHELLEVLLFNACPRKNVNAVAHRLIEEFGSVSAVLDAEAAELKKVSGVGKNMAEYLACVGKSINAANDCKSFAVVHSTAEFKQYLAVRFANAESDVLEISFLDKDGRIRRVSSFAGNTCNDGVSAKELLKLISVYKPYGVFAAFYRAEGDFTPGSVDDAFVTLLGAVCDMSGVRLYDYCIAVSGGEIYSYFVDGRLERVLAADLS